MSLRSLGALTLSLFLVACAQNVWTKPGATQQDFATDSYQCEKDTRQSGYFGGGLVGAMSMQEFMNKCMVAHGWSLSNQSALNQPNPKAEQVKAAVEARKACVRAARANVAYAPLSPYMSDIDTGQFTIAQLADDHVPTESESKLLARLIEDVELCGDQFRTNASQIVPAIVPILTEERSDMQAVALELIKRQISWGAAAKRQQDIEAAATAKLRQIRL